MLDLNLCGWSGELLCSGVQYCAAGSSDAWDKLSLEHLIRSVDNTIIPLSSISDIMFFACIEGMHLQIVSVNITNNFGFSRMERKDIESRG